jgi:hypothetical protein
MNATQAGLTDRDFLFSVLLIECVNNPQPLVVLTKEPLVGFMHHEEIKLAGLPVKVRNEKGSWQRLSEFLQMQKYHHYCQGRVGTQFCSFVQKKGTKEWMATHEGSHFDTFQKLCDVVDHQVQDTFKRWRLVAGEPVNIEMYYPVMLIQGDLFEATETKRSVSLRAADISNFADP